MTLASFAYLGCLLFSLAGMAVLDWRYRLFWFAHPRRAAVVHVGGLAVFVLWDLAGIAAGIFHRGDSAYMTGINLAPHVPLEEIFFLFFLCWLTMNLYVGAKRAHLWLQQRGRGAPGNTRAGQHACQPAHAAQARQPGNTRSTSAPGSTPANQRACRAKQHAPSIPEE